MTASPASQLASNSITHEVSQKENRVDLGETMDTGKPSSPNFLKDF
jgi:hypothetical protein